MVSTAFLDALKAKAAQQQNGRQDTPKVAPPVQPIAQPVIQQPTDDPIIVNCERVLNRNRLDVFFSRKPSNDILSKLHAQGFRWNKVAKCWYHIDSEDNRVFCTCELGASFDDTNDAAPNTDAIAIPAQGDPNSPYETYKRQCSELLEHLKIEAADLQLVAIDNLHKKIFGRDA